MNYCSAIHLVNPAYRAIVEERHCDDSSFDRAAELDLSLGYGLLLCAIFGPRESVVDFCRQTDYGDFQGLPRYNFYPSVVCRVVRAYFLEQPDRMQRELESLFTARMIRPPMVHFGFTLPIGQCSKLFFSVHFNRRKEFESALQSAGKWYSKQVLKSHCTADGYQSGAAINPIASLALRFARDMRDWIVEHDDEFIASPSELGAQGKSG